MRASYHENEAPAPPATLGRPTSAPHLTKATQPSPLTRSSKFKRISIASSKRIFHLPLRTPRSTQESFLIKSGISFCRLGDLLTPHPHPILLRMPSYALNPFYPFLYFPFIAYVFLSFLFSLLHTNTKSSSIKKENDSFSFPSNISVFRSADGLCATHGEEERQSGGKCPSAASPLFAFAIFAFFTPRPIKYLRLTAA